MLPADSPFAPLPAPGPHPATAELRAYAAGTLSPTDEHRIEAHSLDCERCAELLEGFAMRDATTTDRAVAELRSRLQTRVAVPDAAPAVPVRTWPKLAAAAALAGVVAAGLWGLDQRTPDSPTAAVISQEAAPQAAPSPAAEPARTAAPAAPPAETVAAAPAPAPKPEAKQATYAAVTTAPVRRAAPIRTARRSASPAAAPAPTGLLAAAPSEEQADKAAANQEQEIAAAPQSSATENASEVLVSSAAAPDARKMLKRQMAVGDSTARTSADKPAAFRAKARIMGVATSALPGAGAGRAPASPMPPAASINPAPVGGMGDLREYIRKTAVEFEPEARALRLTGLVHVKFIVGADGKLSDFKVTRGLREDYDAEAIRIISEGPAWQPGVAGGRRAPLPMEVTIPF